jgi:hypothetical protein
MKTQNCYLHLLAATLFLFTGVANAEMQYGYCIVPKYLKYTKDGETKYSTIPVKIWWKSDLATGAVTSSFGQSDGTSTKYLTTGVQERGKYDKSDWIIRKLVADD